MIQHRLVQLLLAPVSLLYGIAVALHRLAYASGLLKAVSFSVPVISIGNLSMGGAGKTPHIEWLVRFLKPYISVATLSRGYRRKTMGFLFVQPEMSVREAGDEPLQFKRKFPDISVAVSESRVLGIPQIMSYFPQTQAILLDDAFQHRAVQPGLNILLTEFRRPFFRDFLLPSGRLREWRSSYKRADMIIVSKCPEGIGQAEKDAFIADLEPLPGQQVFFSTYEYGEPYYLFNPAYRGTIDTDTEIIAITGIAHANYLHEYLLPRCGSLTTIEYEDHHDFEVQEMVQLRHRYDSLEAPRKMIITTEKDAMRLDMHRAFFLEHQLPLFVIPVQVRFLYDGEALFGQAVKDYLLNFKA
jgi:tetraacyldisaccharide 4'-kinase